MCNHNKILLMQEITTMEKLSIIACIEIYLHRDILNAAVTLQNYEIYRTDKEDRSHSGVALYIERHF